MAHYHVMELVHHQCHHLLLQHSFVHPSFLHLVLFDFLVLTKATMIIYPHFSIQNQIMQHATTYYNIRFQKDMQIDLENVYHKLLAYMKYVNRRSIHLGKIFFQ
jgi:hypothetical protein